MIGKKADGSLGAGVGVDPVRLDGALIGPDRHGGSKLLLMEWG